jgi:hypothetical protein
VIDTVALVWGGQAGSSSRRADAPARGRAREVLAEPVRLDWNELAERLGADDGQIRSRRYARGVWTAGHWQLEGGLDLMYRDARLEVRASLPKLLVGRNDVVLNDRGIHEALRVLSRRAGDAIGQPLSLREAVPTRLDYCFQWEVPSVAAVQAHLKQTFKPPRKRFTENVSPRGGRSVMWGYASSHGFRFYDKVGELADAGVGDTTVELDPDGHGAVVERGEHSARALDRLLRYEVQDRRSRGELRFIHERGYRAADIREELQRPIRGLVETWTRDVDALIDERPDYSHQVAYVLAALYLAEHDEAWPVLRNRVHRNVYDRWRRRAQAAALALHGWQPIIPRTAFVAAGGSLWNDDELEVTA